MSSNNLKSHGIFIVYFAFVVVAMLFLDVLITKLPIYNYSTQATSYTIFFFVCEVLIFVLYQYLYIKFVRKMIQSRRNSESRRPLFRYIDKTIWATQFPLILFLLWIAGEIVFLQSYHTGILTIIIWVSCVNAIIVLGILIYRFAQWFRVSHNRLILSYTFAIGIIVLNCGIILAYITISIEARPNIVLSTKPSVNNANVVQIPLNNAYSVSSFLSFISIWVASILSLIGYSKKIGGLRFWIAVSLPMIYFVSQSEFIFGPLILSHRFLDPTLFFRFYTITFASTKLVGGIMFAIPYLLVSRKINDLRVSNYLKLTSIGMILLFLSIQVSSLPLLPYPPFGLVSIAFMGLSSYLISVGIYNSAIISSQNMLVRGMIRKSLDKEMKFIGSMVSSEVTSRIVNDVSMSLDKLTEKVEQYTEMETIDSKTLKDFVRDAIREKQKNASSANT
jgi:hypothetical protein